MRYLNNYSCMSYIYFFTKGIMKRTIKSIFALLILFNIIFYPVAFRADLNSFAEDTKREQRENRLKRIKKKKSKKDDFKYDYNNREEDEDNDEDSIFGAIFGAFFEVIFEVMAEDNKRTSYRRYPYESNSWNFFIKADQPNSYKSDYRNEDSKYFSYRSSSQNVDNVTDENSKKTYHFLFSFSYQRTTDKTNCFSGSFTGKFCNMIGPELETRYYDDGNDFLSYTMAGLNFPLFQYDYVSTDLYAGAAIMRGILKMEGGSAGLSVKSIPLNPLSIMCKFGYIFMEDITYKDFGLFAGVTYHGFEIFCGFRTIQAEYAKLRGFETGVRYWF